MAAVRKSLSSSEFFHRKRLEAFDRKIEADIKELCLLIKQNYFQQFREYFESIEIFELLGDMDTLPEPFLNQIRALPCEEAQLFFNYFYALRKNELPPLMPTSLMRFAILYNQEDEVKRIASQTQLNEPLDVTERTALIMASECNFPNITKTLLEFKIDLSIDYIAPECGSALTCAVLNESTDIVRQLLGALPSAKVDNKDAEGKTALMLAVEQDDVVTAQVLLEAKADVNILSANGFSPLWMALSKRTINPLMIRLLLEFDAGTSFSLNCKEDIRPNIGEKEFKSMLRGGGKYYERLVVNQIKKVEEEKVPRKKILLLDYVRDYCSDPIVKLFQEHAARKDEQVNASRSAFR